MKKFFGLAVVVCLIAIFFASCTKIIIPGEIKAFFRLAAIEHTLGASAQGATVKVYDPNNRLIGTAVTNARGEAVVHVSWAEALGLKILANIFIEKAGSAPSVVSGFELTGAKEAEVENRLIRVKVYDGLFTDKPDPTQSFKIEFLNLDLTPADLNNLTAGINIVASVTSTEYFDVVAAGFGFVPGYLEGSRGEMGGWGFGSPLKAGTFLINTLGVSGKTTLDIVVYDTNHGRAHLIYPVNVTNNEIVPETKLAPVDPQFVTRTCDGEAIYYWESSPRTPENSEPSFSTRNAPEQCMLYTRADYSNPADTTGIVGTYMYRSSDGVNFERVAFKPLGALYHYDAGNGLFPGEKAWYKIESLYADGTESADGKVVEVVPFDIFKVKHITPYSNQREVSTKPMLSFQPVKSDMVSVAQVGCGIIPEASITYNYFPAIKDWYTDSAFAYVSPLLASNPNSVLMMSSFGPSVMSIEFLSEEWAGVPIVWLSTETGDDYTSFVNDGLTPMKSYQWGNRVAAAEYVYPDSDLSGRPDAIVRSVTADDFGFFSRFGNDVEVYVNFTTGNN